MAWKPEMKIVNENKWSRNALVFATKEEAEQNAYDLFMRWSACEEYRAVEVDEPIKHVYIKGELREYATPVEEVKP